MHNKSVFSSLSTVFWLVSLVSFVYVGYLFIERIIPKHFAFDRAVPATTSFIMPVAIRISSVDISLPIYPSMIRETTWETTSNGVSYLSSSPLPGEIGNSILYGHNWPNLLGPITKVKKGETIEIKFSDGFVRTFIIDQTNVVTPDQTHILSQTNDTRLTIYTCIGWFDANRFVVTALLQKT